jgi:hypothetical protein
LKPTDIIDGAKALSKVIRRTFGAHTPIQRCQIHRQHRQAGVQQSSRLAWHDQQKAVREARYRRWQFIASALVLLAAIGLALNAWLKW